jgi:hypothetical protein
MGTLSCHLEFPPTIGTMLGEQRPDVLNRLDVNQGLASVFVIKHLIMLVDVSFCSNSTHANKYRDWHPPGTLP